MNAFYRLRQTGFTLVELMIVVALVSIILSLAAPSFREMIARSKLEGVAGEFVTDLQYARSEAAARNANVGLVTGASGTCYTIYQAADPPAGSCACGSTPACTGGPTEIKKVSFAGTGVSSGTTVLELEFEPLRSGLKAGSATTQVTLTSPVGGASLQAEVLVVGRVKTCSPSGSFKGYRSC